MQKKYKKALKKNGQRKKAFSLIELSIVILIVSILITGSLGISKTAINNAKVKVTKERMDTVYKAFSNYLATNRRLPCPASMAVAKGTPTTYGAESATPGTCTGAYISSNASNLAYGMVPILALNLDPDMAEDGFGSKFTYVVDRRFTAQSTGSTSVSTCATANPPSCGFEITEGTPSEYTVANGTDLGGIDVQGPAGTSLFPTYKNGVFLLLSHGANKYKSFNATGTGQDVTVGVSDENENSCDQTAACATTSTASFDRVFIANSALANFDDVAMFKSKTQLVRDAGLEFIICSPIEARTASLSWTTISSYGCNVCSSVTANNSKTCGKYGTWGAVLSNTCTINNATCSAGGQARLDGKWRSATQSSNSTDYAISFSATPDWDNLSGYVTRTYNTASGDYWTINTAGFYSMHFNYVTGTIPEVVWIDKNQASTTNYGTVFSNAPGDVLALRSHGTGSFNEDSVSWVGYLSANDVVRIKMSNAAPATDSQTVWSVSIVLLQQV